MSLDLCELGFHVGNISLSSLYAKLIEGSEDGDEFDFSISFKMSFEAHVEVFSNSLLNGVPESNIFEHFVAESVIREREGDSTAGDLIGSMQWTEHVIIGSDYDRDIHIVSGVDLSGLVNKVMPVVKVLEQMMLDLIKVAVNSYF